MGTTSKQLQDALRRRAVYESHRSVYPQCEDTLSAVHNQMIDELEQRKINALLERLIQEKVVETISNIDINVIVDGDKISSAVANELSRKLR